MGGYTRLAREETDEIDTVLLNEKTLFRNYLRIAIIIISYWFISITMVFLNKQALNQVNAPFFVTWFQCIITAIILFIFRIFNNVNYNYNTDDNEKINETLINNNNDKNVMNIIHNLLLIPYYQIRISIIKKILPLSIVFVAMISFNNLSLQFVGVAFYFVVRSLTPCFNVFFSFIILHKKTSIHSIFCCLGIIFGFALGVDQEQILGTLSIMGVICGIFASMFVSLNSIFVANILKIVDQNVTLLTYYNSIIAIILFIPFILINNELNNILLHFNDLYFWFIMFVSGLFGLLISIVTNLQIQYTSPLTHNISGTAKACSQTILATYIYKQSKTFNWWLSNIIVLISSAMYTFVRQQEMKQIFNQHHQKQYDNKDKCQTNI